MTSPNPTRQLLGYVTLEQAREHLLTLDQELAIIPVRDRNSIIETVAEIAAAADRSALGSIAEILNHHRALLTVLTGVKQLTAFVGGHEAERVHRYRNVLLALCIAAALREGSHPKHVAKGFVQLQRRTARPSRADCDDEVLLLRLQVLGMAHHGDLKELRSAATFALVDSGVTPGETPKVTFHDLDLDTLAAAWVQASGNRHLRARILPLGAFAAHVLATHREERGNPHGKQLVTYQPRRDHSAKTPAQVHAGACASATRVIDRIRANVGLAHSDTTASSTILWRIETVYLTDGPDAATEVSGRHAVENMLEVLYHGAIPQAHVLSSDDIIEFDIAA